MARHRLPPKSEDGWIYAGAASVADGVWIYQLTDKGLALEITAKGTKYSNDDLNKKSWLVAKPGKTDPVEAVRTEKHDHLLTQTTPTQLFE